MFENEDKIIEDLEEELSRQKGVIQVLNNMLDDFNSQVMQEKADAIRLYAFALNDSGELGKYNSDFVLDFAEEYIKENLMEED